jgi:hypothetical protein
MNMRITLEMVDEVIDRTNVSYKIAKEALEKNDGDVLKAIVDIEEMQTGGFKTGKKINGQEIVERLKSLVNEGLVHQILIIKNSRVIVDIPIMAGAISAVIFTIPTVAAIIAAVATGCEIKILKKDGGTINFNELTQEKFDEFVSFLSKDRKDRQPKENKEEPFVEDDIYEEDFFESDDDNNPGL